MIYALCIHGYFSNKDNDNLIKTNYIYDNIINKIIKCGDNVDVFIHSFDIKNIDNIKKKYPSAKKYIIEKQKDFLNIIDIEYKNKLEKNKNYIKSSMNWFSTLSFLYSRKESINLAIKYQNINNFIYDGIITTRFDLGIRIKKNHNKCNHGKLIFDNRLDMKYIYSAFWYQLNAGYADHWFISNPDNIILLGNMYDYVVNYALKINSDYCKSLLNWPDSSKINCSSNIFLNLKEKNEKINEEKMSYAFEYSINNHLLHKYYFIKCGLYELSKFLDYTNK